MEDVKWLFKKCGLPILILLFVVIAGVICWGKLHTEERKMAEEVWESPMETPNSEVVSEEGMEQWEKGYGLPVDEQEEKEAENDCKKMMEFIFDIYIDADKGIASNVVLNDETVLEMQKKLMETECPVSTLVAYSNMENYESVDRFLEECMEKWFCCNLRDI